MSTKMSLYMYIFFISEYKIYHAFKNRSISLYYSCTVYCRYWQRALNNEYLINVLDSPSSSFHIVSYK